jgi:hypothetical protein
MAGAYCAPGPAAIASRAGVRRLDVDCSGAPADAVKQRLRALAYALGTVTEADQATLETFRQWEELFEEEETEDIDLQKEVTRKFVKEIRFDPATRIVTAYLWPLSKMLVGVAGSYPNSLHYASRRGGLVPPRPAGEGPKPARVT